MAFGHAHRPTWRGRVHIIGLVMAVAAVTALLLSSTSDPGLRLGLGVSAVGLRAGSSTPIAVVALPGTTGLILVGAIWSVALLGMCCKLSRWCDGDRAGTAMCAVTIALGAVAVPWLWAREGIGPAAFVVAGGVVYLVGAVCFAKRWPTLRPTVFSFHEVRHGFTVVAAVAQFVAIWRLAT